MRSSLTRIGCIAMWLLIAAGAQAPGSAAAQGDPDLREILPYLMLVIDTSGSMERLPACSCSSAGCLECLPDCTLPNDMTTHQPPTEPPNDPEGRPLKKNRWATTLEALTGTFNNFQCERLLRETQNGATYDLGYFTPYHQPWDCPSGTTVCPFNPTGFHATAGIAGGPYQNNNGILDLYSTRVRFGLMTFDGMDTYLGATSQVPAAIWDNNRSNQVQGLWSFGDPRPFNYPGCETDYMMNTGGRGPQALEGSLVSLNSCSGGGPPGGSASCPSWCSSCGGSQDVINREIQEALLSTRPYGGTPIAGSLHDLYEHFRTGVNDQFGGCRNRFALLVTDGEPDDDYRNDGCDCANESMDLDRCGALPIGYAAGGEPIYEPEYDPALKKCPYPTAEIAARELVQGRPATSEPAMIERLFVVGMAVDQPAILERLNGIADEGCLEDEEVCDADNDNSQALFADDLDGLVENLSAVINSLIEPISRSVPAFAAGNAIGNSTGARQYQIGTGFEVATEPGHPWTGVIERRRFHCADGDLVEDPLDNGLGDRFHVTLNSRAASLRNLFTAMDPAATGEGWGPSLGTMNGHLFSDPDDSALSTVDAPCGATGCPRADLTVSLHPTNFALSASNVSERDQIVQWMRGDSNSVRANKKLGDVYHSSPVIVGSPRFDTTDEAFNLFRQRPEIAGRPLTMYIGSNDGIMHAFSVEAYTTPTGVTPATTYVAGQEMWGFVPPLLLDDVGGYRTSHAFSMDATPVVKNVYLSRTVGAQATPDQYRTILIAGMREGGRAYIALDVTNPMQPQFLWQFTDPHMGLTFGQAAIVQARYSLPDVDGEPVPRQGAVAILPGGVGQLGSVGSTECVNGLSQSMREANGTSFDSFDGPASTTLLQPAHRSDVRCWLSQGRALYFVEVKTGILLKKIYLDPDNANKHFFPSPLISAPAVYPADTGALTTQAYIVDADGVIWRIDMSASDQLVDTVLPHGEGADTEPRQGWTARPFHDIFFDRSPDQGELTYEAPILSVDDDGRVVVIVGTGDNNNFVKPTVRNRVVSLTEVVVPNMTGPERFKAAVNWEMRHTGQATGVRLMDSELVTGTMALFNGTLFFATFQAITGGNACDLGKGRIHAVHYRNRQGAKNAGADTYPPVLVDDLAIGASASIINVEPDEAVDNLMLMGLGLTQRPSCIEVDTDTFDVWDQDLTSINQLAPPAVFLVAQGSGNTAAGTLLQDRAGSRLGSVELEVNRQASMSRVISWATSVD